ncbi:MAG: hypothetical protein F6K11_05565 [Leptolyngbya sp. SIO3F4]|nr:hypothetical protein [Leptolyngbya sp. SIO3F4]
MFSKRPNNQQPSPDKTLKLVKVSNLWNNLDEKKQEKINGGRNIYCQITKLGGGGWW